MPKPMPRPWENDSCVAMKAKYAVYSVPQAAALWCGVPEDQIEEIVQESVQTSTSGSGRGIWKHPYVKCLEPRSFAIAAAMEDGSLPYGREDGKPVPDQVAHERRTSSGVISRNGWRRHSRMKNLHSCLMI